MPRSARRNDNDTQPRRGLFATLKDDVSAAVLEFVGTTVFLLLAFGAVQAVVAEQTAVGATGGPSVNRTLYISLAFGFSLLVSAWLFFRVTGGLFNPNVTTALLLSGIIGPVRFVLFCIAQLAGGIAAAGLVLALMPGPLQSK
jgi:aquaporin rerated protein, other eukaryote